jgi:hypothetical protein
VAAIFVLGLFGALSLLLSSGMPKAVAASSSNLNFQARLLTSAGGVVPDGNYNIDFKIYNADSTTGAVGTCSGACLWEETRKNSNSQGVQVINGYFSVNLGSVTSFPAINWDQQLWLTMNIGGTTIGASPTWDGEMQNAGHSIAMTALPYSFVAGQLALTSGAHRGTLGFSTVANDPAITLPDASGTVCLQSSAACGFETTAGTDFIRNQTSLQTANFNISGTGTIATALQTPLVQTADSALASTADATFRSGNETGSSLSSGNVTIKSGDAAGGTNSSSGSITIDAGSKSGSGTTGTISIGTTNASSVTIGSSANTSTVQGATINIGAVGTATTATTIHIADSTGAGVTQAVTIGSSNSVNDAVTIRAGSTGGVKVGAIGSSTSGSTIDIADTTNNTSAQVVKIGSSANASSTLTLEGATVSVGNSTDAHTINIGNGGTAAQSVNIGSTSSSSAVGIQSGTGNIQLTSNGSTAGTLVKSNTNSTLTFQVQDSSASAWFGVNTSDGYVINNGTTDLATLIQNPGFEASGTTDATGWYTPSGTQVITNNSANARSGNNELVITGNSTTHAVTTKWFAVHPGDQIYVEAYVKNSGGANGDGGIYLEFADKDKGNSTFTNLDTGLPGTSYTIKSTTATIASGKFYVRIAASVKATSTTGSFFFDDFYLKRINEQAPLLISNVSATAFQVQNSSGATVLGVDSTNSKIFSTIADGGSAVGFTLATPSYATSGAKLFSLLNNTTEKFAVDKDGNVTLQGGITANGDISTTGNMNIGSGKLYKVNGTQISSADLSNDSNLAKLSGTGPQIFSGNNKFTGTILSQTTSSTAFQVQNATNTVFLVDASGNKTILGTSGASGLTANLQFNYSGSTGSISLIPLNPSSTNYTLNLPAENGTICTSAATSPANCTNFASASSVTGGLAGKLNKNAVDTSSAAVTAVQGNLYALTNSSSNIASGVLKLDNGNNTGNALYVTGTNDYSTGQAYIVVNNTNAGPAGNLIDLQSNATDEFTVDAAGNVFANGNINIASGKLFEVNGTQISTSNLSDGNTLAKLGVTQTFTGANTFSNASNSFTGDGSNLSNLNASNITSGTLNDGRLSSNVALLNRTGQSFTGDNTFAPTSNGAGTTIKQTSGTATSGSVLDVQTANGSSHFLQITNAAANEGNVTLQSVGATRDLTLGSGSGNLIIAAATNTITHSNSGLTIDINNGTDSTLTITNGQGGVAASLSVEGDISVGAGRVYKVGATGGSSVTCSSNTFLQNGTTLGGIVTGGSCANAVTSISAAGGSIANGASISGNALTLGFADTSNPGLVSNTTQSFNGDKTFTNDLLAKSNSATAFQVQNTSNVPFMVIDTNSNIVNLGITGGTNANETTHISDSTLGIHTVTIGSTNSSSATTVQSGTGFISLISNGSTAGTIIKSNTNSTAAFQIQNSIGDSLLNFNTTSPDLVTNGSFELNTTGWSNLGTGSITRVTTDSVYGSASLDISGSASGDGAKYPITLTPNTLYAVSWYINAQTGSNTVQHVVGYNNGSTNTSSTACSGVTINTWIYCTATFTTPASNTGTPYFYIAHNNVNSFDVHVDAIELEANAAGNAQPFRPSTLTLNSVVKGPLVVQNTTDSTAGFEVLTSSGYDRWWTCWHR